MTFSSSYVFSCVVLYVCTEAVSLPSSGLVSGKFGRDPLPFSFPFMGRLKLVLKISHASHMHIRCVDVRC